MNGCAELGVGSSWVQFNEQPIFKMDKWAAEV